MHIFNRFEDVLDFAIGQERAAHAAVIPHHPAEFPMKFIDGFNYRNLQTEEKFHGAPYYLNRVSGHQVLIKFVFI